MALEIPFSVKITNPLPVIATYMNGNIPFVSTIEANAATAGVRHIGMTVNINNVEYSYKNGILDQDLVIKDSDISRIKRFSIIATTNGVESFTLPEEYSQIIGVFINGWLNEDISKPNNTTVIVNSGKAIGQEIIILYLVDENLNIAPYYTQAQVDALIAGAATTTDILLSDLVFLDLEDNPLPYALTLLDGFKYTLGNYGFIELSLESSVTSVDNYFFKITIDNILIPNNIIALGSIFNDNGDSYSISIFKISNNSIYIFSPNPSPETFNKLTISLKYKTT